MSHVRMCDRCHNIFSENEDDWSTFSGSRRVKEANGKVSFVDITQDACPNCTKTVYSAPSVSTQSLEKGTSGE